MRDYITKQPTNQPSNELPKSIVFFNMFGEFQIISLEPLTKFWQNATLLKHSFVEIGKTFNYLIN